MTPSRPSIHTGHLLRRMEDSIERCQLSLRGTVVLTEAATGPYAATAVLAAMAGADMVFAVRGATRHSTAEQASEETANLAKAAGVGGRVRIVPAKCSDVVSATDLVTNTGHVRPIDAKTISWLKPAAVIALMYEAWELRSADVDLQACRDAGIAVGGTEETNPAIDVFSYLGTLALKLLLDAGIPVYSTHILVLCDNPFAPYLKVGLTGAGAIVDIAANLDEVVGRELYDAILVSLTPCGRPVLGAEAAAAIARRWPDVLVAQFFGDIDRSAFLAAGVDLWPDHAPKAGHMGILLSDIGPEPIVRLQTGGLKAGEILVRARRSGLTVADAVAALACSGYGHAVVTANERPLRGVPYDRR
jgi:hypothetical protein